LPVPLRDIQQGQSPTILSTAGEQGRVFQRHVTHEAPSHDAGRLRLPRSSQKASGTQSFTVPVSTSESGMSFDDATTTLALDEGDNLVFYGVSRTR
jgi:hypothetical protein